MWFLYRIKKQNKRTIKARISAVLVCVQILSLLTIMTGCSSNSGDIPALEEPKEAASAYRPVSKRVVGTVEMFYGTVVPMEYPCFTKEGTDLAELCVAVGDYVNEGDVIAREVSDSGAEQITTLKNEIASLKRERENVQNTSDKTLEKLDYEKKIEEYLQDNEGIQKKAKEIETETENQRYNLAVIDKKISSKNSELSELQSKSQTAVYTAPVSGYVSFVKDLSQSNHVEAGENIAVIMDMNDLYIEVAGKTIDKYEYTDYKSKWTYINGKKAYIKEREYTNDEVSFAKSVKKNPYIQFTVPGEKLTPGVDMVLYFMNTDDTEKLAVGNDSVYRENGEEFVYVRSATNTDASEKRKVELGVAGENYTEVVSGLDEGEMVYYRNAAAIPTKYETATAGLADYAEKCETEFINIAYPYSRVYTADYSGKVDEVHIIGAASEGDALYKMETNIGKADIEDARGAIKELDNDRERAAKDFEKNKTDLESVISAAGGINIEDFGTDTDAIRENMYLAERTQCDLDILTYNEEFSKAEYSANKAIFQTRYQDLSNSVNGDGSGYTKFAQEDGNINSLSISNFTRVEKSQYILTEQYRKEEDGFTRFQVIVDSKDPSNPSVNPKIGEEITLYTKEKSWTGECLGLNGSSDRYILFTRDGKPHSTFSSPFYKHVDYQFYLRIDDEISEEDLEGAKIKFNGKEMKQVIVVPGTSVKTEYDKMAQKDRYYVWKVENGEIVKEYVTIHETVAPTGKVYVLDGVNVGDKLLK